MSPILNVNVPDEDTLLSILIDKLHLKSYQLGEAALNLPKENIQNALAETLQSINPCNNECLFKTKSTSLEEIDEIIQKATHSFKSFRMVPAPVRGQIIHRIGQKVLECKTELAQIITLEMGKTIQEALGEVQEVIDMAQFAVGQSRMLYGKSLHSERPYHRMMEQWHPLGVVSIISAFNFPMAVWAWNAFLAIICGNTVIWKPSEKTPLSALALHQICLEVCEELGFDELFFCVLTQDLLAKNKLVEDKRLGLVSFTGSTKVGREVATKVAARLGRSLLELGGNNAIILDASANLELALLAIVFGAIGTTGQRCTTTRRLFVHEKILDTVCSKLVLAYQKLLIGHPLSPQTHMGPLVDKNAVLNFKSTMDAIHAQIKSDGFGKCLFGGKVIEGPGNFVEPTLVLCKHSLPIIQEETFAPILYIIPYTDFEEAIQMQNSVPQGLSSSLFTTQVAQQEQFLSSMGSDCGIANINIGTSGAEIGGAFGGEKDTGGGREAGSDAWQAYMRRQTSTINWGKALPLAQGISFELKD